MGITHRRGGEGRGPGISKGMLNMSNFLMAPLDLILKLFLGTSGSGLVTKNLQKLNKIYL